MAWLIAAAGSLPRRWGGSPLSGQQAFRIPQRNETEPSIFLQFLCHMSVRGSIVKLPINTVIGLAQTLQGRSATRCREMLRLPLHP